MHMMKCMNMFLVIKYNCKVFPMSCRLKELHMNIQTDTHARTHKHAHTQTLIRTHGHTTYTHILTLSITHTLYPSGGMLRPDIPQLEHPRPNEHASSRAGRGRARRGTQFTDICRGWTRRLDLPQLRWTVSATYYIYLFWFRRNAVNKSNKDSFLYTYKL